MKRRVFPILLVLAFSLAVSGYARTNTPRPYGPVPTPAQLAWQKMEYYMFVHFGPNTFTDKEWGDGREDPNVFCPTRLDCRQWAATAKAAGMKGIIITAKHHDGFCLWPSKYSTHTVRESRWRNGKGDVLKELSAACRAYGLKFGVYLSPWDRNHPAYGTSSYNEVFARTLVEVYENYGPVFEQWFDGANGEGPNGKKQIYDWPRFYRAVQAYQPHVIFFSDIGPGCRWMGNEKGLAGETNWSRLTTEGFGMGTSAPPRDTLSQGNVFGTHWIPAEVDVSIRPGWFYSPTTDDKVKSADELMNIYYTSVGRNSNLLLNVPPTREGRIHPVDSLHLMAFKKMREETFATNLMTGARIQASNIRGGRKKFSPMKMIDGKYTTYWATDDSVTRASIDITLTKPTVCNRLLLQEYIPLGQRIAHFEVFYRDEDSGAWKPLAAGTTIGYKRILRFPPVTAIALRVVISESLACPLINNIGLYKTPEPMAKPVVARHRDGLVTISCADVKSIIRYTTDGTAPTRSSSRYDQPFMFRKGVLRVRAFTSDGTVASEEVRTDYSIPSGAWKLFGTEVPGADKAIDGLTQTVAVFPLEQPLVIDLGEPLTLTGFFYEPDHRSTASNVCRYSVSVSSDGRSWTQVQDRAPLDNMANNPVLRKVNFGRDFVARYIKWQPLETVGTRTTATYSVAEFGVLTKDTL